MLNDFVHNSLRYATGDGYDGPTLLRNDLYSSGKPVKLGDFIDANAGVCREYAACMHVALANTGKSNYMVVGDIEKMAVQGQINEGGRHAWVEYIDTKTGQWMVADPTNGFVTTRDKAYTFNYGGVKDNVERQVFVWPKGVGFWDRIFKKIRP